MSLFPETQLALVEYDGNIRRGRGLHPTGVVEVGTQGLYVGSHDYDPARHLPHDIDPLSPYEAVFGAEQVSLVLPDKPLNMSLVVDATSRQEAPGASALKKALAQGLQEAIELAKPGISDRVYNYVLFNGQEPSDVPVDYELIEVASPEEMPATVSQIALDGLCLVVSDFSHWLRAGAQYPRLENTVAIKANVPAERFVPANIGFVSLGGWYEVDTNKPKQVRATNEALQSKHEEIVRQLELSGAQVAEIVAEPRQASGLNTEKADMAIAEAINQLT